MGSETCAISGEYIERTVCGKRLLSVAVARTVDVGKPCEAVEKLLMV
jgi:hypothetical protein